MFDTCNMEDSDVTKLDLYDVLDISASATIKEIKRAYRKKALTCHPDKNPDNPSAEKQFKQLCKILETLTDPEARVAYDKILNSRKEVKRRNILLEGRRKKLKEDLEERERREDEDLPRKHDKYTEMLAQMRRDNLRELQEEITGHNTSKNVRVKWNSMISDYHQTELHSLLSKYGKIAEIIISQKNKNIALVEFEDAKSAGRCEKYEKGYPGKPLKISVVEGKTKTQQDRGSSKNEGHVNVGFSSYSREKVASENIDDFEADVLNRLKHAQRNREKISEVN